MKYIIAVIATILVTWISQAQEVDQPLFNALKSKIADGTYPNIDAFIIAQHGHVIAEEYFNGFEKDKKHDTRSAFKSVTSLLAGIAVDKQLLALDDRLEKFFPELKGVDKGRISIKDLLEMRSGFHCEEFYGLGPVCEDDMTETEDWIAFCLAVDIIRKPGLNWSYNSNDPMIMGEVIARATGMSVMEFAKRQLFQPLGIEEYTWTISPKGQGMTAGSFYMKPLDMLKIIELVKNNGNWHGQQIVSADWISRSTNCPIAIDFSFVRYSHMPNAIYQSARYGFYWYKEQLRFENIDTEVLFASGNGGQYMMWLPAYDLTAVFTGSNYGNWRGKLPFEMLLQYIIPAIENQKQQALFRANDRLSALQNRNPSF